LEPSAAFFDNLKIMRGSGKTLLCGFYMGTISKMAEQYA
jgi:hypothetical protein